MRLSCSYRNIIAYGTIIFNTKKYNYIQHKTIQYYTTRLYCMPRRLRIWTTPASHFTLSSLISGIFIRQSVSEIVNNIIYLHWLMIDLDFILLSIKYHTIPYHAVLWTRLIAQLWSKSWPCTKTFEINTKQDYCWQTSEVWTTILPTPFYYLETIQLNNIMTLWSKWPLRLSLSHALIGHVRDVFDHLKFTDAIPAKVNRCCYYKLLVNVGWYCTYYSCNTTP